MLAREAQLQAATMSYGDMYFLLSISTSLTLLAVPFIRRPKAPLEVAAH